MRSLTKLYSIAIDNFHLKGDCDGLCHLFDLLQERQIISKREHIKIRIHFSKNKPRANNKYHKSFFNDRIRTNMAYWWELNREGNKQRLLFLKQLRNDTQHWWNKLWWI